MSTALDLFAARQARDHAIDRADAHADDAWKARALDTVRTLAEAEATFLVDDVWAAGLARPREGRAIAGVLRSAQSRGWIEPTAMVRPSAVVHCHGNPRRVWRSKIYRPNAMEAQNRAKKARAIAGAILRAWDGTTEGIADALANMGGDWWDGIARCAAQRPPSDATIAMVLDIIEGRA